MFATMEDQEEMMRGKGCAVCACWGFLTAVHVVLWVTVTLRILDKI